MNNKNLKNSGNKSSFNGLVKAVEEINDQEILNENEVIQNEISYNNMRKLTDDDCHTLVHWGPSKTF